MESRFLLDVIVTESSAIFQLFTGEDESLLIGGNTFLVLDFSFHILNGVWGFNIQGNSFASEGLNEDLHILEILEINYKFKKLSAFYTLIKD